MKPRLLYKSLSFLLLLSLLALGIVYYSFYQELKQDLRTKIDSILAPLANDLSLNISYGEIRYNFGDGPKIKDVTLVLQEADSQVAVRIPHMLIQSTFESSPHWHVHVKGLKLAEPILQTNAKSPADAKKLIARLKQAYELISTGKKSVGSGKSKSRLKFANKLKLQWAHATVSADILAPITDIQGHVVVDKASKQIELHSKGSLNSNKVAWQIKNQNTGWQITFQSEHLNLKPFQKLAPSLIRLNQKSTFKGKVALHLGDEFSVKRILLNTEFQNLGIEHWRIAETPIDDISAHISGVILPDFENKIFELKEIQIGNKSTYAKLNSKIDLSKEPKIQAKLSLEKSPIQKVLALIPQSFIPIIHDVQVSGTMQVQFDLDVDAAHPHRLVFDPKIEVEDFELIQSPKLANIHKLKKEFHHVIKKDDKIIKEFTVGKGHNRFVPYRSIGKTAIRGVLTCEDGSFMRHGGFQLKHFKASIIQNLREKRFARGASTISMQLAKNLFLNGNKNISRKFQEALIAYTLEQELDKKRMLEIYLNIIEWGKGMYGIGNASRHYFYKYPSKLLPIEAAFLGSIIANPKKHQRMHRRGYLSGHWETYLAVIVSKMRIPILNPDDGDPSKLEFGWVRKKRLAEEKKTLQVAEAEVNHKKKRRRR